MSKRPLFVVAAALAGLTLAGCGSSSLCARARNTYASLGQKGDACGYARPAFNENLCEQDVGSCTPADQNALEAYLDCLNGVQTCQPGNEDAYNAQIQTCYDTNEGISNQTCIDAFTAQ